MREASVAGNVTTYNTLIDAFGKAAEPERAWQVFQAMQQARIAGNAFTYSTLIDAFGKAGEAERAWQIYRAMRGAGITGNAVTYNTLIGAFGKVGEPGRAWQIFQVMRRARVAGNAITYSTLIDAYYRAERWQDGIDLLTTTTVPAAAQPNLAELYRKSKQYSKAQALCENVLNMPSAPHSSRDHAWIVRLYVLMHVDNERFSSMQAMPPFGDDSVHWTRLLCARVFSGVTTAQSSNVEQVQQRLSTELAKSKGRSAERDIQFALDKPHTRTTAD